MAIPLGEFLIAHRWKLDVDPEPMISTYGIRNPGAPGDVEGTLNDVAAAFDSSYYGDAASYREDWTYLGFLASLMTAEGVLTFEKPANRPSTASDDRSCPTNCALLIQKKTPFGGRRNRGRMFLPAGYLPELFIGAAGNIDGASLIDFQNGADEWLAALSLAGLEMTIHHATAPFASTEVTSLVVSDTIATQRQRMRR